MLYQMYTDPVNKLYFSCSPSSRRPPASIKCSKWKTQIHSNFSGPSSCFMLACCVELQTLGPWLLTPSSQKSFSLTRKMKEISSLWLLSTTARARKGQYPLAICIKPQALSVWVHQADKTTSTYERAPARVTRCSPSLLRSNNRPQLVSLSFLRLFQGDLGKLDQQLRVHISVEKY